MYIFDNFFPFQFVLNYVHIHFRGISTIICTYIDMIL